MSAPQKEVEVSLKDLGCPYAAEDPRTLVWLEGYRAGETAGMDAGARVVSEVYDRAFEKALAK